MQGKQERILVTGAAGFIGFHVCRRLLADGELVVGVDNLNPYYDPALKRDRLRMLEEHPDFRFHKVDLEDFQALGEVFQAGPIDRVCHLAAQAGVRYSITDPFAYQKSNLEGFLNILELIRRHGTLHLVYASSSSVYGKNQKIPFSVDDRVDHPISLYAATKKANELMAHAYSYLYGIPCTGLRYFTVYGPWGRPDMALFIFTKAILEGRPIEVYNHGHMKRDFTYIDDIVDGTLAALKRPAAYELFNLGNSATVELVEFIRLLEEALGQQAEKRLLPLQPGDVPATAADIDRAKEKLGFNPKTTIEEGIRRFVAWYREYYGA